jgi:hypothetical protein
MRPALLIPDEPPLRPAMAAALSAAEIKVYTYTVKETRKSPEISFSDAFLARFSKAG